MYCSVSDITATNKLCVLIVIDNQRDILTKFYLEKLIFIVSLLFDDFMCI